MSRSAREKVLGLEADVERLLLAPAAEVRRRGQRRSRRRIAAAAAASVFLVSAVAGFAVTTTARDRDPAITAAGPGSSANPASVDDARCGPAGIPVNLRLPDDPAEVPLRVFNGTARGGLDDTVAAGLRERRFAGAQSAGDVTDPLAQRIGLLRYGPRAIGSAQLVRAFFGGEPVALQFDRQRGDDTVDVVLGPDFRRLASPTEVNQALAATGPVTAPAECRSGS